MNKHKIIWSPRALEELNRSYKYISYNLMETNTARNLYNKIMKSVSGLKYFPGRYPDLSYYGNADKNFRRLRVDNFIIIYRVNSKTRDIFILHIFHSKQNYFNLL